MFAEIDTNIIKKTQKPRNIPLYKKAEWDTIRGDMASTHAKIMEMESDNCSVDDMWEHFRTNLDTSIKANIPHKECKTRDSVPWITPELKKQIHRRDRLGQKKKNMCVYGPPTVPNFLLRP